MVCALIFFCHLFSAYTTEPEFSFIPFSQFEIIFLKEPNQFQIPLAKFSFDCSQFHFFKSKLNHSRNYFLHNFFAVIFRKRLILADFRLRFLS